MKILLKILIAAFLFLVPSTGICSENNLNASSSQLPNDTLLAFAKKYVAYLDNVGAKEAWRRKVYVKRTGHQKFTVLPNPDNWPDSIEKTVNIIYLKDGPAVYIEIPIDSSQDIYREYDRYYYKGRIIAAKIIQTDYHSKCTADHGLLNEKTFIVYDSSANIFHKEFSATDSKNQKTDLGKCGIEPHDKIPLIINFSDTPLMKEGIEKR